MHARAARRARSRARLRRTAAGTLLLGAAWLATLALAFVRTVARPPATLPASGRAEALAAVGAAPGRPAFLVGWDPDCGACDVTRAELGRLGLEAAGVTVTSLSRYHPAAPAFGLDRGPFPAYLLLDESGTVRGVRRGYASPEALHLWARSRLLASP